MDKSVGVEELQQLALDLMWSWNHCADNVWKELEPELWELTHNPWVILQTMSRTKIEAKLGDSQFSNQVKRLLLSNEENAKTAKWFQKTHPHPPLSCAAYFSMEFMLSEALPIYSGGLGNVAGDQLKAASDLGVPVIGIGLLYQQGYFRQLIDKDGWQKALYPYNEPQQLPIRPLRKSDGEWLRLQFHFPGWPLWVRIWEANVGRVKLYLLDTNDSANNPVHRGIASELYGGDSELRLKQEMLLGIGGWRVLNAMGLQPEVCHLNEGHAAFAVLERANCFMKKTGLPFKEALEITQAGNHFTTHTAVPAGFDRFSPELIEQYMGGYCKNQLSIPLRDLLALGRNNPDDGSEPFNMAYLAMRTCASVNGVSKIHACVSRRIFQSLFPRWPQEEVPVGAVTNGVHVPSWDSMAADDLWTQACGKERWLGDCSKLEEHIRKVPEEKIWQMRNDSRKQLIDYARGTLARILAARGHPAEEVEQAKTTFDPGALTIGFARRFATYKRVTLLLSDPGRLLRLLKTPGCPVQLIFAGKAHPADKPGQEMIRQWMQFIQQPEVRSHIIFLSDYDMHMTEMLVQGVDVWINTPRRPWEACGTSGMKVLVNGGLNLSELDGWWAEAYSPEVGWSLGDGKEHGADASWDTHEANQLFELLEKQILPEFYTRDDRGVPTQWINKIRESMALLTPRFSANRAVREYVETYYLPAAGRYNNRTHDLTMGKKMVEWKRTLEKQWGQMRFGAPRSQGAGAVEVELYPDTIDPAALKVQLFACGEPLEVIDLAMSGKQNGALLYKGSVRSTRPLSDYTPRAIPSLPGVEVPLEMPAILWGEPFAMQK